MRILLALLIATISLSAYTVYMDVNHPRYCVDEHVVKSILELKYRDALIELDNGQHVTVYQASLKPGDTHCLKWER